MILKTSHTENCSEGFATQKIFLRSLPHKNALNFYRLVKRKPLFRSLPNENDLIDSVTGNDFKLLVKEINMSPENDIHITSKTGMKQ